MAHVASDNTESVLLNDLPAYRDDLSFPEISEHWERFFALRDDVMQALEMARADKLIGKSLDAAVTIYTTDDDIYALLDSFSQDLSTVYIVSGVTLVKGEAPADTFRETSSGIGVRVEIAEGDKCDRCWMHSTEGIHTEDGFICARCAAVIQNK